MPRRSSTAAPAPAPATLHDLLVQRSKRGWRLLTRVHGAEWVRELLPQAQHYRLHMSSPAHCALGFLYGEYSTGVCELLGNSEVESVAHGFNADYDLINQYPQWFEPPFYRSAEIQLSMLTEIWTAEILRRARKHGFI